MGSENKGATHPLTTLCCCREACPSTGRHADVWKRQEQHTTMGGGPLGEVFLLLILLTLTSRKNAFLKHGKKEKAVICVRKPDKYPYHWQFISYDVKKSLNFLLLVFTFIRRLKGNNKLIWLALPNMLAKPFNKKCYVDAKAFPGR